MLDWPRVRAVRGSARLGLLFAGPVGRVNGRRIDRDRRQRLTRATIYFLKLAPVVRCRSRSEVAARASCSRRRLGWSGGVGPGCAIRARARMWLLAFDCARSGVAPWSVRRLRSHELGDLSALRHGRCTLPGKPRGSGATAFRTGPSRVPVISQYFSRMHGVISSATPCSACAEVLPFLHNLGSRQTPRGLGIGQTENAGLCWGRRGGVPARKRRILGAVCPRATSAPGLPLLSPIIHAHTFVVSYYRVLVPGTQLLRSLCVLRSAVVELLSY